MNFNGKTILITGGTGSFGSNFCKFLLDNHNPKRIVIFSRDELKQFNLKEKLSANYKLDRVRFFLGDVRDKDRLIMACKDVDIIIHAAALKQVPAAEYNPTECIKTNINGAENIVKSALENKVSRVGNILREEIINYSVKKKDNDKNFFSILVLGGSQGADIFGKIIPSTIKMLKDEGKKIKINQQCVASQKKSLIEFYNKNYISNYVFDFSSNILELISSSDLAISRCGASTTAELLHTFTPFIAVPYPHSMDNHQYLNAQYYESKGYCWLLEQDNFSSLNLFNLIISIINDKKKLENIYKNMKKNDSTNVYDKVETEVKKYI